jgi:hypothetical protein
MREELRMREEFGESIRFVGSLFDLYLGGFRFCSSLTSLVIDF